MFAVAAIGPAAHDPVKNHHGDDAVHDRPSTQLDDVMQLGLCKGRGEEWADRREHDHRIGRDEWVRRM